MGEKILVNGVLEEVVRVACAIVPGNPNGYRIDYRSRMKDGEVEFEMPPEDPAPAPVSAPAKQKVADDELLIMSARELRDFLVANRVDFGGGINKAALVALAKTVTIA